MHDTVIRNGTIVDGTGRAAYTGDLAIDDGRISVAGGNVGAGHREIDADGALVTPGWVDVHTHYDGQATWDPILAPSSWHGVTTAMFGNCGVGFAPVRKAHHQELIDLMEAIEEIPGTALADGLTYEWESFPEFLDVLDQQPRAIDVAAQVPHHPLRVYVMGERALRRETATAADIAAMHDLTAAALRAGAFGFTTSRTNSHKTLTGEFVPGRYSEVDELKGIGASLSRFSHGAFGMNSDFDDESGEFTWMTELSRETGRPAWFLLTDRHSEPGRWRRLLAGVHAARAQGGNVTAQVACRPVGVLLGIGATLNPFSVIEGYQPLRALSPEVRLARMRDPAVRAEILAGTVSQAALDRLSPSRVSATTRWERMYVFGPEIDYEPTAEKCVITIAERTQRTPEEVAYDYLTEGLDRFLYCPVSNYGEGNLESTREMMLDSGTLLGLSDGGAHCGSVVDASMPSYLLSYWARDRTRGPRLPLEALVKAQTSETADFFGFSDRGRLVPGFRADVNVIDHARLKLKAPEIVKDLPSSGQRLVQAAEGYVATLVAGEVTFEHGEHTGALPGRLVRAGG